VWWFGDRFEKIYLWMDDDIPGQEGAAKFAQKLGIKRSVVHHSRRHLSFPSLFLSFFFSLATSRCLLVRTKQGDPEGPKDANDALRAGKVREALCACTPRPLVTPAQFSRSAD
jgi:twinkle protein